MLLDSFAYKIWPWRCSIYWNLRWLSSSYWSNNLKAVTLAVLGEDMHTSFQPFCEAIQVHSEMDLKKHTMYKAFKPVDHGPA